MHAMLVVLFLVIPLSAPRSVIPFQDSDILHVTVVSDGGTPIGEAFIEFLAEGETSARGACITDQAGQCTLSVLGAPRGASGLIRGSLRIGDGKRPVTWPGGELNITITTTDSGLIRPPTDFVGGPERATAIPTGIPSVEPTFPPVLELIPTAIEVVDAPAPVAPTSTHGATAVAAIVVSTASAAPPAVSAPAAPLSEPWVVGLLLLLGGLISVTILLIRRSRRGGRRG